MDDPVQLAYFAGLIDGEGCITIKQVTVYKNRRRTPTHTFSLCIEMADPRPIKAMCDCFGLTMKYNTSRHRKNPDKHRFLYVAQIGRVKGIEILKAVLPYLHAKREEAELAIEFYEKCFLSQNHQAPGRNKKPTPAWLLDLRHDYYLRLQALKRRSFADWQAESPVGPPSLPNNGPWGW